MGNFYELLAVPRHATEAEIRSAYGRDMMRLLTTPKADSERFRLLLDEALETLTDPEKRSAYDAQLRNAKKAKKAKPPKPAKAPKEPKPPKAAKEPKPLEAAKEPKPAKEPKAEKPPKQPKTPDVAAITRIGTFTKAATIVKKARSAVIPADPLHQAASHARNGGLAFAIGGVLSGVAYLFLDGPALVAWAPLLLGGVGLGWSLVRYLRLPPGSRRPAHMLALGGLICLGLISGGWVGLSDGLGPKEAAQQARWNATIQSSKDTLDEADGLVTGVLSRTGAWTSSDSADMSRASKLYAEVAGQAASAPVPSRLEWYRTGLSRNLADAADITRAYELTPFNPETARADLSRRWQVRVDDMNQLSDRLAAEESSRR